MVLARKVLHRTCEEGLREEDAAHPKAGRRMAQIEPHLEEPHGASPRQSSSSRLTRAKMSKYQLLKGFSDKGPFFDHLAGRSEDLQARQELTQR